MTKAVSGVATAGNEESSLKTSAAAEVESDEGTDKLEGLVTTLSV